MGKIKRTEHQETLDSTDGIIDAMKDILIDLLSEINDDELDAGIIDENEVFFSKISKLIPIISSKQYSALLKIEKLLKPAVNTAGTRVTSRNFI